MKPRTGREAGIAHLAAAVVASAAAARERCVCWDVPLQHCRASEHTYNFEGDRD